MESVNRPSTPRVVRALLLFLSLFWALFLILHFGPICLNLSNERAQQLLFPFVVLVTLVATRNITTSFVKICFLLSLPAALLGLMWSRGEVWPTGSVFVSLDSPTGLSSERNRTRTEYNRLSELFGIPEMITLQRELEAEEAEKFLATMSRSALLIHGKEKETKLSLAIAGAPERTFIREIDGINFELATFPKGVLLLGKGRLEYFIKDLAVGFSEFDQENDKFARFDAIRAAAIGASQAGIPWRTPLPRAAVLLLSSAADLMVAESPGEFQCARRELASASSRLRQNEYPELQAAILNNRAILILLEGMRSKRNFLSAKRLLRKAIKIKDSQGRPVEAAKVANRNIIALGAGRIDMRNRKFVRHRRRVK